MNGVSVGVIGLLKSCNNINPFLIAAIPIYPTSILLIAKDSTVIACNANIPTFCYDIDKESSIASRI